jgi:2-keto-3-deoxy-L-rhamnonate aldolase RhmA
MGDAMQPRTGTTGNLFLDRLHAGELKLMLGIRSSRTTDVVHIAHSSGHHSIVVDLEHSTMSTDVVATLCATAGSLGMTPIVRVPEREYGLIGRLLDGGAHGIVAPRIETVEEARQVARACRSPPADSAHRRRWCPSWACGPFRPGN